MIIIEETLLILLSNAEMLGIAYSPKLFVILVAYYGITDYTRKITGKNKV